MARERGVDLKPIERELRKAKRGLQTLARYAPPAERREIARNICHLDLMLCQLPLLCGRRYVVTRPLD